MWVYKIDVAIDKLYYSSSLCEIVVNSINSNAEQNFIELLSKECETYSELISGKGYFFFCEVTKLNEFRFGLLSRERINTEQFIERFLESITVKADFISIHETTLFDFGIMLKKAYEIHSVEDDYKVLYEYDLGELVGRWGIRVDYVFFERFINEIEWESIIEYADFFFAKKRLMQELERLYTYDDKRAIDQPVHYILEGNDEETIKGYTQLLLQASLSVGRINNSRYSDTQLRPQKEFYDSWYDALYKSSKGGAVVLRFDSRAIDDNDHLFDDYVFLEKLCSIINRYSSSVLTILCLPGSSDLIIRRIIKNTKDCNYTVIRDDSLCDKDFMNNYKFRLNDLRSSRSLCWTVMPEESEGPRKDEE